MPLLAPRSHPVALTLVAASLALAGCKNLPLGSNASSVVEDCAKGGVWGAIIGSVVVGTRGKQATAKDRQKDLAKAALAGCVISVAATAIGKLLTEAQQARYEKALHEEAQRLALARQTHAGATQQAQAMPASTPKQRAAQDAAFKKAQADYEAAVSKTRTVNLGEGATAVIGPVPGSGAPAPGQAGAGETACVELSGDSNRPGVGRARQYETLCPNKEGQLVWTQSREAGG